MTPDTDSTKRKHKSLRYFAKERNRVAELKSTEIIFADSKITVGEEILDLSNRPQMAKVIGSFFENDDRVLNKSQLIEKIYAPGHSISMRLEESYRSNIVKMLSRARKVMKKISDQDEKGLTWFLYDRKKKSWKLCQRLPHSDEYNC